MGTIDLINTYQDIYIQHVTLSTKNLVIMKYEI